MSSGEDTTEPLIKRGAAAVGTTLQETNSKKPALSDLTRDWKFHRGDVLKEVFEMSDKDGDGKLAEKEMGQALRLLGLNPTEPQIREMIIEQNSPKGKLDYRQFVDSLESAIGSWSVFEDLMLAFSVFDPQDSGYVNKAELKDHLTMIGDPLDNEEADDWLSIVDINGRGDLNYRQLINETIQREGLLEPQ